MAGDKYFYNWSTPLVTAFQKNIGSHAKLIELRQWTGVVPKLRANKPAWLQNNNGTCVQFTVKIDTLLTKSMAACVVNNYLI